MLKQRILLVDDSELFRTVVTRTLVEAGYEIGAVAPGSAFDALKACLEFKPDLVLLDCHIPNCNADTLCVILKEDQPFNAVKVLAISTDHDPATAQTMLENGADAFVTKGSMASLIQAIGATLAAV